MITLFLRFIINVIINYLIISNDRDFLFEFELLVNYNLDLNKEIFIYIINILITFI